MMLTERQEDILRAVIEGYVEHGRPVGSRWLAERFAGAGGPSTVRKEFAVLEASGMLAQPHTSAGRVPTDRGFRYLVDELLRRDEFVYPPGLRSDMTLSLVRTEVTQALRETTEVLADVTDLLALVSAPSIETETILRVEVVPLRETRVMVVVITSTGGVTKRVFSFGEPVDQGLAGWATGFLNDTIKGVALGARTLRSRLLPPDLDSAEQAFIETVSPALLDLSHSAQETLYTDGASRLLSEARARELPQLDQLMSVLEQRAALLALMRTAIDRSSEVQLRIGSENTAPALVGASVVTAAYGIATRRLGTVGVIGPVRMDYPRVIGSVRFAAAQLSAFMSDVYE